MPTGKVPTVAFPNDLCSALPHPHIGFSVSPRREDLITTIAVPQLGFEQLHFSPMCMSTSSGYGSNHRSRIVGGKPVGSWYLGKLLGIPSR
jgi:hypothetical protein